MVFGLRDSKIFQRVHLHHQTIFLKHFCFILNVGRCNKTGINRASRNKAIQGTNYGHEQGEKKLTDLKNNIRAINYKNDILKNKYMEKLNKYKHSSKPQKFGKLLKNYFDTIHYK